MIIADLLANQFYGLAGVVTPGDLTQYKNFCTANGLFLSPVLDAQKAASDWIQEILDITNAAAVWSEGVLKLFLTVTPRLSETAQRSFPTPRPSTI